MREYTKEEIENMKCFERAMWLRDIKVGAVVTDKMYEAVQYFLGSLISVLPEIKPIATIHFDKMGQPHTLNDDIIQTKPINKE